MKAKKNRAIITIGGVALGVGAIVLLVSIGYGLEKLVIGRVAKLDELKMADVTLGKAASIKLNDEAIEKINTELRNLHEAEKFYYEKNLAAIKRKIETIDVRLRIMYEDRLDGRITVNQYDERVKKYKDEQEELWMKCNEHSEADKSFYINASKILDLASRAWEIFESSEPAEKTQLLNLILQNFSLEQKKLSFEAKNPFAGVLECSKTRNWLGKWRKFGTTNLVNSYPNIEYCLKQMDELLQE
jgi:hypothetical protein